MNISNLTTIQTMIMEELKNPTQTQSDTSNDISF